MQEATITMVQDTTCLTSTLPSQKEQLNLDYSNLMNQRMEKQTDFTQDNLRATFNYA